MLRLNKISYAKIQNSLTSAKTSQVSHFFT